MHCCIDFLWMTQFNWELSCITSLHKFSIISKKCNQSYFFECTEAEMKANKFISKFPMNSEWWHPNDMQQSLKWVSAKSRLCLFNRKHECKHFVREMQCDEEKKTFRFISRRIWSLMVTTNESISSFQHQIWAKAVKCFTKA